MRGQKWDRPQLGPSDLDREFFEAAAQGSLLVQRCNACGHRQFYPRQLCTACAGEVAWETASGRGLVHTFTIVRQNGMPPFKDLLPYAVAMIELDEGVRMMGNVTGCPVEQVKIGLRVEAYAVECEPGLAVPFWRPAP